MRRTLFFLIILISLSCSAAQLVDPYEIEAESPHMLDPGEVYTSCTDKKFEVSLEKPSENQITENGNFKLNSNGGSKIIKCKLKDHLIESEFSYSGSSGSGYCGGAKFIKVSVSIDSKRILSSPFANYCTTWGLSSFQIKSYSEKTLDNIIVCGYWPATTNAGSDVVESRTYNCTNFNAEDIIQKNHPIGEGPNYISHEY